jgi:hypothetical protein
MEDWKATSAEAQIATAVNWNIVPTIPAAKGGEGWVVRPKRLR